MSSENRREGQSRKDAIADAETLRINVNGLWCKTKLHRDLRADLRDADAWGVAACQSVTEWRSQSDHCARQAARAALCAVPALRGGR